MGVLRRRRSSCRVLGCSCFVVRRRTAPRQAGHADFDIADASSGDDGAAPAGRRRGRARCCRNPIIMTIACIEFCSGFLRQAIMQWYRTFAKATGARRRRSSFEHWGMLSASPASPAACSRADLRSPVRSRRGPVSAVLYGMMLAGALMLVSAPRHADARAWSSCSCRMAIIGVHGMLSGTASMDFGGKKNAGVAVGHHRRLRLPRHRPRCRSRTARSCRTATRRRSSTTGRSGRSR